MGVAQNLGLGDETVGSLAAWSAPSEDEFEAQAWGSWGLFESINAEEMADRLFGEAETWLFEHMGGMAGIRGPLSLEPLVSPGLLTDGFDADSTAFLPYNPPYYPEMVESQGYEPVMTWRAYMMDLVAGTPRLLLERERAPLDRWRSLSRAWATWHEEEPNEVLLSPGLREWLAHLAGDGPFHAPKSWRWVMQRAFATAIAVVRETDAEAPAACFGIPDLGPALKTAGGKLLPFGWLRFEIALRRTGRFRIFPAAAPSNWEPRQLADLYGELTRSAGLAGYRQAVIAPISDADERSIAAMNLLRTRARQQFTVYEKRF